MRAASRYAGVVTARIVAVVPELRWRSHPHRRLDGHSDLGHRLGIFDGRDYQRIGVDRLIVEIPLPGRKPPIAATAVETSIPPAACAPTYEIVVIEAMHVMFVICIMCPPIIVMERIPMVERVVVMERVGVDDTAMRCVVSL